MYQISARTEQESPNFDMIWIILIDVKNMAYTLSHLLILCHIFLCNNNNNINYNNSDNSLPLITCSYLQTISEDDGWNRLSLLSALDVSGNAFALK